MGHEIAIRHKVLRLAVFKVSHHNQDINGDIDT